MPSSKPEQGQSLADLYPEIAKEWHPDKNGDLKPTDVKPGSQKKVWWKCTQGHEWYVGIGARIYSNTGCPYCSGKKILVGYNDFQSLYPEIAKEWHPTLNGDFKPSDIRPQSNEKVWWKCSKGHEWQAKVQSRVLHGDKCPYCSGRKAIVGETDFQTIYPEIAKEWHPTKNGNLKPTDVKSQSSQKIWWQCSKGHEWQSTVAHRTVNNSRCPYCFGNNTVLAGENDLQTTHPDIAKEWHPTLNGDLKPTDVRPGSNKMVWWKCSKGHEWCTRVQDRVNGKSNCPHCSAQGTSYPEQFIYWSFKQLYPDTINRFKTSNKVEYDIYIPNIRLAIEYSGKDWHKGREERDTYKRQLAEESNVRFIDIIEDRNIANIIIKLNHFEYNSTVNRDESLKSILSLILQDYNHSISEIDFNLVKKNAIEYSKGKLEYEKSLAYMYPEIAKEWHPTLNGDLKPTDVRSGINKKVWWKCPNGHEYLATVGHRTYVNSGCPYCNGNHTVLAGENDLQTLYPDIAKEWHPILNGDLKPTDVRSGSTKKVWWKCSVCGHEWQALVNSRTRGTGCPECWSKRRGKK